MTVLRMSIATVLALVYFVLAIPLAYLILLLFIILGLPISFLVEGVSQKSKVYKIHKTIINPFFDCLDKVLDYLR